MKDEGGKPKKIKRIKNQLLPLIFNALNINPFILFQEEGGIFLVFLLLVNNYLLFLVKNGQVHTFKNSINLFFKFFCKFRSDRL